MMYGLVCIYVHVHGNYVSQAQQPTGKPPVYADLEHPDGYCKPAAPLSSEADKVMYTYVKTTPGKEPQVSIASTKVSSDATIGILVPVLVYTKLPLPTNVCISTFVVPRS